MASVGFFLNMDCYQYEFKHLFKNYTYISFMNFTLKFHFNSTFHSNAQPLLRGYKDPVVCLKKIFAVSLKCAGPVEERLYCTLNDFECFHFSGYSGNYTVKQTQPKALGKNNHTCI